MDQTSRPCRSLLYIPASKERAIEKARGLPTDGIIFDLEDAVAPDAKPDARKTLAAELTKGGFGPRILMARVNGWDSEWIAEDLDVVCAATPQAILLPKASRGRDIVRLSGYLDGHPKCADTKIWAMIENPVGVMHALEIATASPRFEGMVVGTNDLTKDLHARSRPDRLPLQTSLQRCVLAARTAGVYCIDGVYNAFKDTDGLRAEAEQGLDLGFDGKSLIHPAQLEAANEMFSPTEEALELAHRQIAAFEAAVSEGKGIAVVDGSIVENLHLVMAKGLLAKAAAIQAMEAQLGGAN